jgi:hypothetical protein
LLPSVGNDCILYVKVMVVCATCANNTTLRVITFSTHTGIRIQWTRSAAVFTYSKHNVYLETRVSRYQFLVLHLRFRYSSVEGNFVRLDAPTLSEYRRVVKATYYVQVSSDSCACRCAGNTYFVRHTPTSSKPEPSSI